MQATSLVSPRGGRRRIFLDILFHRMRVMAIYQQLTIPSLFLWSVHRDAVPPRGNRKLSRRYLLAESSVSFTCSIWWVGSLECICKQDATQPESHKY